MVCNGFTVGPGACIEMEPLDDGGGFEVVVCLHRSMGSHALSTSQESVVTAMHAARKYKINATVNTTIQLLKTHRTSLAKQ